VNKPVQEMKPIKNSSDIGSNREDVPPLDARELHRRHIFRIRTEISLRATNQFTPDEDAILGEILGTNDFDLSEDRIKNLSKRCNMSYERTLNGISSLYYKGAFNLHYQGKK
jgi:hypothetical protein